MTEKHIIGETIVFIKGYKIKVVLEKREHGVVPCSFHAISTIVSNLKTSMERQKEQLENKLCILNRKIENIDQDIERISGVSE